MRPVAAALVLVLAGSPAEAPAQDEARQDSQDGAERLEIGIIDFYGRDRVAADAARAALTFKVGDTLDLAMTEPPAAFRSTAEALKRLPDVLHVGMSPVCCDAGRLIVYVGIEERGAPALHLRKAPEGEERLPDDVVRAGKAFMKALLDAVKRGDSAEDHTRGHTLSHDPATRAIQEEFLRFAQRDLAVLRRVLRKGSDAGQRALAAQVLGYAPDKQAVVSDLVRAMHDPDDAVRNNAMRSLLVFAETAPGPGTVVPRVPAGPFIEFLHSPEWTDRNKASGALLALTAARDPDVLAELRRSALTPLLEMAAWQSAMHALPAYMILARIAGKTDEAARQLWDQGNRRVVIDALAAG